jgi:hypothetical protein
MQVEEASADGKDIGLIMTAQGDWIVLDVEDFKRLKDKRFQTHYSTRGNTNYATHHYIKDGKKIVRRIHHYMLQPPEGYEVDHINHDGFDNRRENLRLATKNQNAWNATKTKRETSSRYKGVCWEKSCNKWRTRIRQYGKKYSLGCYDFEDDAARAYNVAATKMFGEFACLNVIEGEGE